MLFLSEIFESLQLECDERASATQIVNKQQLPSFFEVSSLASSSFVALGEALKSLLSCQYSAFTPTLEIDQRLASLWFDSSLHLVDLPNPTGWDPIAGDYETTNGWIRLHTNAPHHKAAVLDVLGVTQDRARVADAVRNYEGLDLETAIVSAGGCAAQMRSLDDWAQHPQGRAVRQEPLIDWSACAEKAQTRFSVRDPHRPLKGLKVLDLTRVIAGPVATRALAGLGATVLRIDPINWNEPALYEDLTIGKLCAHLDLKSLSDCETFLDLVAQADVLVHGLRSDALPALGLSVNRLRELNPALIDVAHNAYGWTGPWANRRGFDSLVQMSAGIADYGMKAARAQKPLPLPVQALDHATGYLVAAATIMALQRSQTQSCAVSARMSLARVASLLAQSAKTNREGALAPMSASDFAPEIELTHLGKARRLKPAIALAGIPIKWDVASTPLRTSKPTWRNEG